MMKSSDEVAFPLLQKFYSLEAIVKETWSRETTRLYVAPDSLRVAENGAGAESLATLLYLHALGLPFELRTAKNVAEMSPSAKCPLLKCGRFVIGEFEPIVSFCQLKGHTLGNEANTTTSSESHLKRRTQCKALLFLVQKHYSNMISLTLWKEASGARRVQRAFGANYPWPLSSILYRLERAHVQNRLERGGGANLWREPSESVLEQFDQINEALDKKLNVTPFLTGQTLNESDILLYSYLKVMHGSEQLKAIFDHVCERFGSIRLYYLNLDELYKSVLTERLHFQ